MELTPQQAAKVKASIEPCLDYLRRLQARLEHLDPISFDPLNGKVIASLRAVESLVEELDDIVNGRGLGRGP